MDYTDYVASNDYTDMQEYELIVRVFASGAGSFAWYRSANTKVTISDSQFDVTIDPNDPEESITLRFNAYYVSRI